MQQIIQQIQVIDQSKDNWHYIWGDSTHSSSKLYHLSHKNLQLPRPFIWIWDSRCANKFKVFSWLQLRDRLSVRDILRRKNTNFKTTNTIVCCVWGTVRNQPPFVIRLPIQSEMLVSSRNWLAPRFAFPCYDGGSQKTNQPQLLHGILHNSSLDNMEGEE
jgi:hypothetical protein